MEFAEKATNLYKSINIKYHKHKLSDILIYKRWKKMEENKVGLTEEKQVIKNLINWRRIR